VLRSEAATASLPAAEDVSIDPGQLAGITTLCVDNEPSILDGMETLLRGWGCAVIKAPDLGTAIAAIDLRKPMPNGLLIDYHLDHGNGIEAITELRRRFGDLPAILITADRSPRVRAQAREANVQVLNKPIKPAALRAMLSRYRKVLSAAE
jgi:CheY-like chemotaxis protein